MFELVRQQKHGHSVVDFFDKIVRVADYHRARLHAFARFLAFPLVPETGDRQYR